MKEKLVPSQREISKEDLQRMKNRDPQTWGDVTERLRKPLLKRASTIVGFADAEDIVQEAWARVYKDIDRLDDDGSTTPYIYNAVRYAGLDYLKKMGKNVPEVPLFVPGEDGEGELVAEHADSSINVEEEVINKTDNRAELKTLFEKMPEEFRASFYLKNSGFSRNEISEITGVKPMTVGTQAYRGLNYVFGKEREKRKKKPSTK